MPVTGFPHSLERIISKIIFLEQVRKEELNFGDLVLIDTQNSTYSIYVLQNNFYLVSGGWFDRNGLSPRKVKINGCTWGGDIVKIDILAACGLHLELSNGLVTSEIKKVIVFNMYGMS